MGQSMSCCAIRDREEWATSPVEATELGLEAQKEIIRGKLLALDAVISALSGVEDPDVAATLSSKVAARAALRDQLRDREEGTTSSSKGSILYLDLSSWNVGRAGGVLLGNPTPRQSPLHGHVRDEECLPEPEVEDAPELEVEDAPGTPKEVEAAVGVPSTTEADDVIKEQPFNTQRVTSNFCVHCGEQVTIRPAQFCRRCGKSVVHDDLPAEFAKPLETYKSLQYHPPTVQERVSFLFREMWCDVADLPVPADDGGRATASFL